MFLAGLKYKTHTEQYFLQRVLLSLCKVIIFNSEVMYKISTQYLRFKFLRQANASISLSIGRSKNVEDIIE